MPREPSQPVTRLLRQWAGGDKSGLDELIATLNTELRHIARRYMRLEQPGHTLQTTALINEAYLKLVTEDHARAEHKPQFFALAAQVMHHILVDHARAAHRQKRGDGVRRIALEETLAVSPQKSAELLALDEALSHLAEFDARKARVVELRYFGGMDVKEIAVALQLHPNTVVRDWRLAKAWLKREMGRMEQVPVAHDAS